LSLWNERVSVPGSITIQAHPSASNILLSLAHQLQTPVEVIHEDLGADIRSMLEENARIQAKNSNFFLSYATYDQMEVFLSELAANYSSLATLVDVGTTIQGRKISGLRITGSDGSQPNIVMNGLQHAREWISPMTVAYLAQGFLESYTTDAGVQKLVDSFVWTIIPIVNADGYVWTWDDDRMWRKNRRVNANSPCFGVDINRNWGYQWGTGGSSSIACTDTYMGPSAFSEPEETAVANLISSLDNVVAYIDFHAYGQLFMYPWGYTCSQWVANNITEDAGGNAFATAVKSVNGLVFEVGPVCQTIYQASGGSNDWTYGAAQVPYSYACELRGNSFILPADQIIPSGEEIFAGVQAMGNYILSQSLFD